MSQVRGYNYEEIVSISEDTLPNFDTKIKSFYEVIFLLMDRGSRASIVGQW